MTGTTKALKEAEIEGPFDLDILAELVGYQLHRAEIDSYRQFMKLSGKLKVTPKQFSALVLIGANPDLSQTELRKSLGMDRATTAVLIAALDDRNLLERQRSTLDRRRQKLRLTQHGTGVLKEMKLRVRKHDELLTSGLTSRERRALASLLRRIRSSDETF
jgi:DNA-binding MarR family transcriptional regulator